MLLYILKRVFYVVPVALGVSLLCFLLVHIAPGDPLVSVLPADASQALVEEMRKAYGFDRPLPAQFALWLWRATSAPRSPPAGRWRAR
jgi:peptide/nickel transport system permease protein